jgi:hypothetical protein
MNERGRTIHELERRALWSWGLTASEAEAVAERIWVDRSWLGEKLQELEASPLIPESVWGTLDQLDIVADDIDWQARELSREPSTEELAKIAEEIIRGCRNITRWVDEARGSLEALEGGEESV